MKRPEPTPRNIGRDFANGDSIFILVKKYNIGSWPIEQKIRQHVRTLRKIERRQRK